MPPIPPRARILILIALAVFAYLPALHLPFIADDYTQIPLARQFAAEHWTPLFHEVNLRARATYMFLDAALDSLFGFAPMPFYAASLVLHILCVLLVYASGIWLELGTSVTFWAAAFFAVQEGHQEAVIWIAAAGDLLVFLFGMTAWICWVKWFQGAGPKWYTAAVGAFVLAAISKESVWIFAVLLLLPIVCNRAQWRKGLMGAIPFLALAATYVLWTWHTRVSTPGYNDVRFSLNAPWLLILLNSFWKLLFPWGIVAGGFLLLARRKKDVRLAIAAILWMLLALVPYSFLTYMLQVPSRMTYLASAGLAWLVGAAAARLFETRRTALLTILCIAAVAINLEILWVKKMSQFEERAEPTELLKQAAADSSGPVTVTCFSLPDFVAEQVLHSVGVSAQFEHPATKQPADCFAVQYRNRQGAVVRESRRLGTTRHSAFY